MDISSWLNQTISIAVFTAGGTYGDGSFGAAAAASARVQPKQQFIHKGPDEDVFSTHEIWTTTAIGIQDRIWLPGLSTGDATLARVPLAVEQHVDKFGATKFYKVFL